MKRIIAIDYGDARTGVAVSDLTGTLAGEALTIQEWNAEKLAQRLAFFARERDAEKFVLGLPKNMDGTEGPARGKGAAVQGHCWRRPPACRLYSGTSGAAPLRRTPSSTPPEKKKKSTAPNVDAVAATLLLEGYLASPNDKR